MVDLYKADKHYHETGENLLGLLGWGECKGCYTSFPLWYLNDYGGRYYCDNCVLGKKTSCYHCHKKGNVLIDLFPVKVNKIVSNCYYCEKCLIEGKGG